MSKHFGVRLKEEDEFYFKVVKDYISKSFPFEFNDSDVFRYCLRETAENIADLEREN